MMNLITSPLLTDLYQLTMLQGYIDRGMHDTAVFEFSVRDLPESRGFLVSAGLESVLDFLENFKFSKEEIEYLSRTKRFSHNLIDYLAQLRFTGSVCALPEGTIFFPDEPTIRISAPIAQAQIIESRLMNLLHYQSLIATKAARCYLAAEGKVRLVDFGLRRAHGAEAGIFAARSSYIAGFAGTSTVLAGALYGIPIFGTMAHSFIEAQDDEKEAFITFALANPDNVTLLIDTYNTLKGADKAVRIASLLKEKGIRIKGVRLDSGDIIKLSKKVRKIFDESGLSDIKIFVSGNIDEYKIKEIIAAGASIDGIGVGTKMDTSADVPYLDCGYKLMEYAGIPRLKKSKGKETIPGRKQVFRQYDEDIMVKDILTVDGDQQDGQPLLQVFMQKGKRISKPKNLEEIRAYTLDQLKMLPPHFRELQSTPTYTVEISNTLLRLKEEIEKRLGLFTKYFCTI